MFIPRKELLDQFLVKAVVGNGLTIAIGDAIILNRVGTGVFTVTIASPAVFSQTAHGLVAGDAVQFQTSGALPTGLVAGTTYYVIAAGLTSNAFEVSATLGGSAVNTSGSQSGTHSMYTITPTVKGAANTTAEILGTVRSILGPNAKPLEVTSYTTALDNTVNAQVMVEFLPSQMDTTYLADLSAAANTTPNSNLMGWFNLSTTLNGTLDESSYVATNSTTYSSTKQFFSYGVNPSNSSQVIGIWASRARI